MPSHEKVLRFRVNPLAQDLESSADARAIPPERYLLLRGQELVATRGLHLGRNVVRTVAGGGPLLGRVGEDPDVVELRAPQERESLPVLDRKSVV